MYGYVFISLLTCIGSCKCLSDPRTHCFSCFFLCVFMPCTLTFSKWAATELWRLLMSVRCLQIESCCEAKATDCLSISWSGAAASQCVCDCTEAAVAALVWRRWRGWSASPTMNRIWSHWTTRANRELKCRADTWSVSSDFLFQFYLFVAFRWSLITRSHGSNIMATKFGGIWPKIG